MLHCMPEVSVTVVVCDSPRSFSPVFLMVVQDED